MKRKSGLMSSLGYGAAGTMRERRETKQAFEEEAVAAMPKVCQLLLSLAPMAQTAPGQSMATLVQCQRRKAEQQVCAEPEKFVVVFYFCLKVQSIDGWG